MSGKPTIREIIVVEGRYDKNALLQVVDAVVITTEGFGLYKNNDKAALLRRLAERTGIVVLTDGDRAGFQIRSYLKSKLAGLNIKHAYVPDIYGRERRKSAAGKDGLLGVEGMTPEVLLRALWDSGATFSGKKRETQHGKPVNAADLFELGMTGTANARDRRGALLRKLDLPQKLSIKGLLAAVNVLYTREEFFRLAADDES